MSPRTELLLLALAPLVLLLFAFVSIGDIGPKRLKDFMRRYQRWGWGNAAPFDPIDPYTPIEKLPEVVHQDSKHFPPMRERMNNAARVLLVAIAVGIILFVVVFRLIG